MAIFRVRILLALLGDVETLESYHKIFEARNYLDFNNNIQ